MQGPVRVFIIDDHDDVRRALVMRLKASPSIEVIGDSGEADAALLQVQAQQPQVVLVETKRADGRGLEIVSWLALSGLGTRVFVLTSYPSQWERWAVRRAGAEHYFLKEIDTAQLIEQILCAATTLPQSNGGGASQPAPAADHQNDEGGSMKSEG